MQETLVESFRLSPLQRHLCALQNTETYFPYYSSCMVALEGPLNPARLYRAWQHLIERHEILRTVFPSLPGESSPVQVVRSTISPLFSVHDLSALSPLEQETALHALREGAAYQRPAQETNPIEAELLIVTGERSLLHLRISALNVDTFSYQLIMRELSTLYAQDEQLFGMHEDVLQYADLTEWQYELLESTETVAGREYWQGKTDALSEPRLLLFEQDHASQTVFRPAQCSLSLSSEQVRSLEQFAQIEQVSFAAPLLACWIAVLGRLSEQETLTIGTRYDGRKYQDLAAAVGPLTSYLPLSFQLTGEQPFSAFVRQVEETLRETALWQEYFNWESMREKEPGGEPFWSAGFDYELLPPALRVDELLWYIEDLDACLDRFKLWLSCRQDTQGLHVQLHYDQNLFHEEEMQRLLTRWKVVLQQVLAVPDLVLGGIEILTDAERELLLEKWNDTRIDIPQDRYVQHLLAEQAGRTPDCVAIVCAEHFLTYEALLRRARQLGCYLQTRGVMPDVCVGLYFERSIEMVVALLGTLLAGGAYLPLDPAHPQKRLTFMLDDAQAPLILTQQRFLNSLSSIEKEIICLDRDWSHIAQQPAIAIETQVTAENLAYVLYTSGSTGQPKGVMVTHGGLLNYLHWCTEAYAVAQGSGILVHSPLTFDLTVTGLFPALLVGLPVTLLPEDGYIEELGHALEQSKQLSLVKLTPAHLDLLRRLLSPDVVSGRSNAFVIGGEALNNESLTFWRQYAPETRLINEYGPTETVVGCCVYEVPRVGDLTGPVPIGRPIANTRLYLLDRHFQLVPIGLPGELYIGGAGLARGYLHRPDLTAERFIPDPFSETGGERLYRTGDLACYQPDGTLHFLGRLDTQVKVRGYRIELSEIEAALLKHPALAEVVVVVREEHAGEKRLVAYFVTNAALPVPSSEEMREHLRTLVPEYMLPAFFVPLAALPLTSNGKIDRKALPAPESLSTGLESAFVAARTPEEAVLATIWSQILRVSQVSIHDNFFSLGGDSILSIQVIAKARQAGYHLTVRQIFQHQTIAQLAGEMKLNTLPQAEQGLLTGSVPLTPIQAWFFAQKQPDPHYYNQAMVVEVPTMYRLTWLEQALWHLLYQHDALRLRFSATESGWQQEHADLSAEVPFVSIDLSMLSREQLLSEAEGIFASAQASLDLMNGPVLRCLLIDCGPSQERYLVFIAHHLVIDGVSWRILLSDLEVALAQLARNDAVHLPPKTTSFQQWAYVLHGYAQSAAVHQELAYWCSAGRQALQALPTDFAATQNTEESSASISIALDAELTRALLQDVPVAYHTQVNDILLTALVQAFATWTGQRILLVDLEGHGRQEIQEELDLSHTVGWFTTLFSLLLDIEHALTPGEALKAIKEQLRQTPQQGLGYGALRYLHADPEIRRQLADLPQAQVSFNYLGQFDNLLTENTGLRLSSVPVGPVRSRRNLRSHLLIINGSIVDGRLRFSWQYSRQVHRPETIQRLSQAFLTALENLIRHCVSVEVGSYTPSDFPLAALAQFQLDRLVIQLQQAGKSIEDIYPLSPMQAGLLFHSLSAPTIGSYHGQFGWLMRGPLDSAAWRSAWEHVVKRHAIFRTLFLWHDLNQPLQVVCQNVTLPWNFFDWRGLDVQEQQQRLHALLHEDQELGFPLDEPPLLRFYLIRVEEQSYYFLRCQHHLLLDGWSQPLVFREVQALYQAYCQGRELILPPPRRYHDYIAWLQQQDTGRAEQFWRTYLAGFTTPTVLGQQIYVRGEQHSPVARSERRELPAHLLMGLQRMAQQHQLTVNTLTQGAWALVLARYSRERDIVFGATVSGRPAELPGVESMVGLFINTLPVRVQVDAELPLLNWLLRLQEQQAEARQYEYTPLVEIQRWSEIPIEQPLFESLYLFQNYPAEVGESEQTAANPAALSIQSAHAIERTNYPLALSVAARNVLTIQLTYDSMRFDEAMIDHLLSHFTMLLEAMPAHGQRRLGDLPALPATEMKLLLEQWNPSRVAEPPDRCVHELIEQQVERTPDAIAVLYGDEQLTYGVLSLRASQVAAYLQASGVGPDRLVGVCMERSLALMVMLLGILKAGGAYLPLDPTLPVERFQRIFEDSQLAVLLIEEKLLASVPAPDALVMCLERVWPSIAATPPLQQPCQVSPGNLAYVIYTSGSTGLPKGVMIPHQGLLNYLSWAEQVYQVSQGEGAPVHSPLGFDLTVTSLFTPLLCGRPVLLLPSSQEIEALLEALRQGPRFSLLKLTPAHLTLLNQWLTPEQAAACARTIVIGGEELLGEQVRFWQEHAPNVRLINEYGPTETVVGCCVYDVPVHEHFASGIPIGRPIANTQLYVLDPFLQPVPVGAVGELYIGGLGLARGYLAQPVVTAEKFVPHPFSDQPGERLYRSGDLVRYGSNGTLEYLGRVDQQVKLRGYRIELGEIEEALRLHPQLADCVVLLRKESEAEPYLVAYVVPRQQAVLRTEQLRDFLRQSLPEYMLPPFFIMLEQLPLNANGKIDRKQLPRPEKTEGAFSSPTSTALRPIEEMLATIWQELLHITDIALHDDFFMLGGHSLLAMRLISRIRTMVRVEIPYRSLFQFPTIADLARLIENELRGGHEVVLPELVAVQRTAPLPVSFAQQRLWFLEQLEPGNTVYLIAKAWRMYGALDVEALERSLQAMIVRHESLRTTFESDEGQARQIIHQPGRFVLPIVDLTHVSYEREAQRLVEQEKTLACDLVAGPLLRVCLLRLAAEEHVLLLTMHHIISDGWSHDIFMRELTAFYRANAHGEALTLPELPLQYADFAVWQRQWLQGAVLENQLAYWKQQLQGIAPLELPTDNARPAIRTFNGAAYAASLPAELQAELVALSQREGVTQFMLLLAAFFVLLFRSSGQEDISVGTPIANRPLTELEGLIGFFVNTLVLRVDLADNPTFSDLLARVREVTLGAYAHQDIPFEYLVEAVQPERDLSRSPLFQVMFDMQQIFETADRPEELSSRGFGGTQTTAKFDLTFHVLSNTSGLHCVVEYNRDLFQLATIQRLFAHWQALLQGIVARPAQHIADLPLLTPTEYSKLLIDWNDTQWEDQYFSADRCLHELFELQVGRTPDLVAAMFEDELLTYQALNRRANQLAHRLLAQGIGLESRVGICMERSLDMLIAIFATLKAGGSYVPLDPASPAERLTMLLHDFEANLLLTRSDLAEALFKQEQSLLCVDTIWQELDQLRADNPPHIACSANAAYVLYTSGSTGTPKGVIVEHCQVVNYISALIQHAELRAPALYNMLQPLNVDSCLSMLFPSLLTGSALHIIARTSSLDAQELVRYGRERPADYLKIAPSHLAALLNSGQPEFILPRRCLIIGGEASQEAWANQLQLNMPEGVVYNHYGPTETTVGSLMYRISLASWSGDNRRTLIGRPLANTQVYILDARLHPVPVGIVGELYLGGAGLARGYLGRADVTGERFIPHPFSSEGGARLYKTGDLVRYRTDGNIEFIGRNDDQVKIRGYRIELGEIEASLLQHPAIREAIVIAQETVAGDQRLAAALIARGEATVSYQEIQRFLRTKLPEYMHPSAVYWCDDFPHTPHGKLDRRALSAMMQEEETHQDDHVQLPQGAIEELVIAAWKLVLRREQVNSTDDFFASGGHSLLAMQLIARLRATFQVELSLRGLFEAPTITGLVQQIEQALRGGQQLIRPPLLPVTRTQALPLSFAQQRLWFLHQLDPRSSVYLMPSARRLRGAFAFSLFERSLEILVQRHESLCTTFEECRQATAYLQIGQPMQVIHPASTYQLPLIDLGGLAPQEQEQQVQRLADQESEQPCDLQRGPLLRCWVVRQETEQHVLLLTLHHIISDGWSMQVLLRELTQVYLALSTNVPLSLPSLPIQYADFAVWQRQWLQGGLLESQLDYWRQRLSGAPPVQLPWDHPRPDQRRHRGAMHTFHLPAELSEQVRALSQQEGVTLFMTLLAAFQVLLSRLSGQQDIVIGTDSANRTQVELEGIIGFFINLLVLRTDLSGRPSFQEVLRRVREVVLGASVYQETPFDLLVERFVPQEQLGRMPLIQVLFVMQNIPVGEGTVSPLTKNIQAEAVQNQGVDQGTAAKFDLAVFIQEVGSSMRGVLVYDRDLFERATIQRLQQRFVTLLQSAVRAPQEQIERLELIDEADQQRRREDIRVRRQRLRHHSGERFDLPQ